MTVYARVARLPQWYLRCPLFFIVWWFDAPNYFWGALLHRRLLAPEFWGFTFDVFWMVMLGGLVDEPAVGD